MTAIHPSPFPAVEPQSARSSPIADKDGAGDRASKLHFRSTSEYGALCQVPSAACGGGFGNCYPF